MLKLLIADDEPKICQLIEYIIDWQALGIEIVGIVNNGGEAYEKIIELNPDIVITDIHMPVYDGLELIEKVKQLEQEISFILVSGYSEFAYAKKAISFGVENYLLKPIKRSEVEETIYKILQRKKFKERVRFETKEIAKEKEFIARKNREILMRKLLFEYNSIEKEDIEIINKNYSCRFMKGKYLMFIARPFISREDTSQEILLDKMKDIIETRQSSIAHECLTITYNGAVVVLLNNSNFPQDEIRKEVRLIHIELQKLRDIFEHLKVVISISSIGNDLTTASFLYNQAREALWDRFVTRESILYFSSPETERRKNLLGNERRNMILRCFERWDVKAIAGELGEIQKLLTGGSYDGHDSYQYLMETFSCLELGCQSYMESLPFPYKGEFEASVEVAYDLKRVFQWIDEQIVDQFERYKKDKEEEAIKPIRMAQAYITEHYNEKLSLTMLSDQLGFNPSYFSVLFKKETGKNFMDYVIEVRMECAKQLLVETDYDIYDIANRVGYTDIKYFAKLFKKYVELSPAEYRKLYN